MIANRKAVVVSVLGAMLAAGGEAGAAEPVKERPLEGAASRMEYVLEAMAGGDLLGGRAGLELIFEGMAANKAPERKKSGARLINMAAGDKDEGWPPKNPFGPQKPPDPKPQPPTPPVKDPPRQTPPPPPPPPLPPTIIPQRPGTIQPA